MMRFPRLRWAPSLGWRYFWLGAGSVYGLSASVAREADMLDRSVLTVERRVVQAALDVAEWRGGLDTRRELEALNLTPLELLQQLGYRYPGAAEQAMSLTEQRQAEAHRVEHERLRLNWSLKIEWR